ncbi:MAG: hypothetical protein R3F20_19255 [Planctomycetota bacterium]
MKTLEMIGPDNWREFLAAPVAVLMLGKSTCDACTQWSGELSEYLAGENLEFSDVRFGKLLLDQRGLIDFKKENPWIAEITALPFTIIFRSGEKVKEFAGGGIDRLTNRLERVLA